MTQPPTCPFFHKKEFKFELPGIQIQEQHMKVLRGRITKIQGITMPLNDVKITVFSHREITKILHLFYLKNVLCKIFWGMAMLKTCKTFKKNKQRCKHQKQERSLF